jgi:cytochrome c-type biogenesis protein CcmH/NrfF
VNTRRDFLRGVALSLVPALVAAQDSIVPAPDTIARAADRLREPWLTGQQRDTVTALDNDPVIIAIERRLRCTCGCTLDIYTCRTTDFTCTYSPELHKELVGLYQAGKSPEEIVQFYVDREGTAILMAPPTEGFNLAGYLVPGIAVSVVGLGLAAYLSRRRQVEAVATAAAAPAVDDEQMARLRKALDEVDS